MRDDDTTEATDAGDEPDERPSSEAGEQPSKTSAVNAALDGEDAPTADAGDAPEAADAPRQAEPEVLEPEPVEILEPEPELTAEERLRAQLDASNARLRAVSKAYADLQAENKAYRERVENQAKYKRERKAFELAREFFEPVQNLKRSVEKPGDDIETLVSGLEMVLHQFTAAMGKLGMEPIPGVGAKFDPRVHEALAVSPVLDPEQDGKILMVHTDGYMVNGKVLRASQVVIGKYEETQGEA